MDNLGYVLAAYLTAFAVLFGYWLSLKRRIRRWQVQSKTKEARR